MADMQVAQSSPEFDSQSIASVQARLNELGFEAGTPDGVLGPRTIRAIMQFQARRGDPPNGQLSAAQLEALATLPRAASSLPFSDAPRASVEAQLPGYFIQRLQTVLNALGYNAGPEDGVIGQGMRQAIAQYQADMGLVGEGTITAETITALEREGLAFLSGSIQQVNAGQVSRPSFNCANAGTAPERAICADATLGELDRMMADAYKIALAASPGQQEAIRQ